MSTYLTNHALKIIEHLFNCRSDFCITRVSETTWIACYKDTFKGSIKDMQNSPFPTHHMCYEIVYNADKKVVTCSCLNKQRTGMPCAHVFAWLNNIHPSLFHPRWLKVWNSHLSHNNINISNSLNELVTLHKKTNAVPIEELNVSFTTFTNVIECEQTVEHIALWLMHKKKMPLKKGMLIPRFS